ncbi:MAG: SDR family NAD(P)-dependent oxidoreductase [Pseudomonadota bacterium]
MEDTLFSIAGRVALVSGASSGLGERFAVLLASRGAKVVCVARREDKLADLVGEIRHRGNDALAVAADVTDEATLIKAFDVAEAEYGPVEILVNCAGIQSMANVLDMSEEQFTSVLDINVSGMWRTAKLCAQRLVKAKTPGSIINIASILGMQVRPSFSNYCASKAAVLHMTKALALDLMPHRIRVNALAPGYFETELTRFWLQSEEGQLAMSRLPIARFGELKELDGPLLLLASDASSYMSGSVLTVDAAHSVSVLE